MKQYYVMLGGQRLGPMTFEELSGKNISKQAMVWHDGMDNWKPAGQVADLASLFASAPPPYVAPAPPAYSEPPKSGSAWRAVRIIAGVIVGIFILKFLFNILNNPRGNGMVHLDVNPPKARIVENHANEDPSSKLFAFREGVYCTILNEGGAGRLLVKAKLYQGSNIYERTQEVFLQGNQSQEMHFVFTEPRALGGEMKYEVNAVAL